MCSLLTAQLTELTSEWQLQLAVTLERRCPIFVQFESDRWPGLTYCDFPKQTTS